MATVSQKIP